MPNSTISFHDGQYPLDSRGQDLNEKESEHLKRLTSNKRNKNKLVTFRYTQQVSNTDSPNIITKLSVGLT